MARLERDNHRAEARRRPREQHVDGNKRRLVAGKCLAQLCAEEAKCAHVFCHLAPNSRAQRKSRDARSQSAHDPVLFAFGPAVNNIESIIEPCEQPRDFLGRMLQIVIYRHDHLVFCRANAAKQSVVLAVIAHQINATHEGEPRDPRLPPNFDRDSNR